MKRYWIIAIIFSTLFSMVHAVPLHVHERKQQTYASHLIDILHMIPNAEGGHFVEIYRDKSVIKKVGLPDTFDGDRNFSTAIYFLLDGKDFSTFHRLKSDEGWHYYTGNTNVKIYEIKPNGELVVHDLGNRLDKGESFFTIMEKGSWFGAKLNDQNKDNFALVGCTVAPGFDPKDIELGTYEQLSEQFPQHEKIIKSLTRN